MQSDVLIKILKEIRPELEAHGVTHLALFGSRARGDYRPGSDVDLLLDVKVGNRFSLLDLIGVEHMVGDTIGLKANAVMRRSLDDRFREGIKNDIVAIF